MSSEFNSILFRWH